MAATKTTTAVDEWAEVAQNAVREGGTTSVATSYGAALNINCAISSGAAHTGTKIEVQVSSNTTGDEDWHTENRPLPLCKSHAEERIAGKGWVSPEVREVVEAATHVKRFFHLWPALIPAPDYVLWAEGAMRRLCAALDALKGAE